MNRHRFFLRANFRFAAVIAFGLFIQTQFGCSLIKSGTSNNSNVASNGETTVVNNENTSSTTPNICRNAYYPVGSNVSRKYHIKYEKMANLDQDYTETYSGFSDAGFVSNTAFKEVTSTINWRCLPDGLLATQYGNSIDLKSGGGAKIDTINSRGISFPADSRWNPGEKWTTDYEIKEMIKNPDGQAGNVDANGTINQNGEIIGSEEVTVPAGTFQTMKVKVRMTLDLTVKIGAMTMPTKTNLETTSWFAKDVGMVKSQTSMGGIDSATTELLSYSGTK